VDVRRRLRFHRLVPGRVRQRVPGYALALVILKWLVRRPGRRSVAI
jgi:hypothetical protein